MQVPEAAADLERDLRATFGDRLISLVIYQPALDGGRSLTPSLAIVDSLTPGDLGACSSRVAAWQEAGLATPLLLTYEEFGRSLDVFPLEFGGILEEHVAIAGPNPFTGLKVEGEHLRHACEVQARSHLLHLREGYLETGGRGDRIADLITRSAEALATLIRSVARLRGMPSADVMTVARDLEVAVGLSGDTLPLVISLGPVRPLSADAARQLIPKYLEAVQRLTRHVDRWSVS